MIKELGPVLTALMVTGRVGSGIAAEIGSMRVTEQIDALQTFGTDPIKKLVTPRLLAALIMLPILTMLADVVGIIGGLIGANTNRQDTASTNAPGTPQDVVHSSHFSPLGRRAR